MLVYWKSCCCEAFRVAPRATPAVGTPFPRFKGVPGWRFVEPCPGRRGGSSTQVGLRFANQFGRHPSKRLGHPERMRPYQGPEAEQAQEAQRMNAHNVVNRLLHCVQGTHRRCPTRRAGTTESRTAPSIGCRSLPCLALNPSLVQVGLRYRSFALCE